MTEKRKRKRKEFSNDICWHCRQPLTAPSMESRGLAAEELGQNGGSEIGGATHEGVPQATKVRAIPHLLREDVTRIALASYMRDTECPVVDKLTHIVFALLHVTEPF